MFNWKTFRLFPSIKTDLAGRPLRWPYARAGLGRETATCCGRCVDWRWYMKQWVLIWYFGFSLIYFYHLLIFYLSIYLIPVTACHPVLPTFSSLFPFQWGLKCHQRFFAFQSTSLLQVILSVRTGLICQVMWLPLSQLHRGSRWQWVNDGYTVKGFSRKTPLDTMKDTTNSALGVFGGFCIFHSFCWVTEYVRFCIFPLEVQTARPPSAPRERGKKHFWCFGIIMIWWR